MSRCLCKGPRPSHTRECCLSRNDQPRVGFEEAICTNFVQMQTVQKLRDVRSDCLQIHEIGQCIEVVNIRLKWIAPQAEKEESACSFTPVEAIGPPNLTREAESPPELRPSPLCVYCTWYCLNILHQVDNGNLLVICLEHLSYKEGKS